MRYDTNKSAYLIIILKDQKVSNKGTSSISQPSFLDDGFKNFIWLAY